MCVWYGIVETDWNSMLLRQLRCMYDWKDPQVAVMLISFYITCRDSLEISQHCHTQVLLWSQWPLQATSRHGGDPHADGAGTPDMWCVMEGKWTNKGNVYWPTVGVRDSSSIFQAQRSCLVLIFTSQELLPTMLDGMIWRLGNHKRWSGDVAVTESPEWQDGETRMTMCVHVA